MPVIGIQASEEAYEAFWDMKNDLGVTEDGRTSTMNHGEALEYLLAVHARYGLRTENPRGYTPDRDVACADCGDYYELLGPFNLTGELYLPGDMVCLSCAEDRGYDPEDPVAAARGRLASGKEDRSGVADE